MINACVTNTDISSKNNIDVTEIDKVVNSYSKEDNVISRMTTLMEFESKTKSIDEKKLTCNLLAEEFSYVGDYTEALFYMDKYKKKIKQKNIKNTKKIFEEYKPVDAVKAIGAIAQKHQIIFINEAHHIPMHRILSIKLLKILYNEGFRYFAAETVSTADKDLNYRGYPLTGKTGVYTDEPVYGELIRYALKLGYEVVPYESEIPCERQSSVKNLLGIKDMNCQNYREYHQALNIYNRILKKKPKAKIFVHAGYAHIAKMGNKSWTPMCEYFIKISGIKPFTIDQVTMGEHSNPDFENSTYKEINQIYNFDNPIVLTSLKNKYWASNKKKYDLQIFHPRTTFVDGRPNWMSFDGSRTPYFIKRLRGDEKFPCLVSAYKKDEGPKAVPIDRILLKKPNIHKALMLPRGRFIIIITDKTKKVIVETVVNMPI